MHMQFHLQNEHTLRQKDLRGHLWYLHDHGFVEDECSVCKFAFHSNCLRRKFLQRLVFQETMPRRHTSSRQQVQVLQEACLLLCTQDQVTWTESLELKQTPEGLLLNLKACTRKPSLLWWSSAVCTFLFRYWKSLLCNSETWQYTSWVVTHNLHPNRHQIACPDEVQPKESLKFLPDKSISPWKSLEKIPQ